MDVTLKRLDELIRRIHPEDRHLVKRFMEFVIAGGYNTVTENETSDAGTKKRERKDNKLASPIDIC